MPKVFKESAKGVLGGPPGSESQLAIVSCTVRSPNFGSFPRCKQVCTLDGKAPFQKQTRACRNEHSRNTSLSGTLGKALIKKNSKRSDTVKRWKQPGTACVSECVLKTLAFRGLRVGPSEVCAVRKTLLRRSARTHQSTF